MPGGWVQLSRVQQANSGDCLEAWYKFAAGGETNFTYTTSASERSSNRTWRVTGAHASTPPEAATGGANATSTTFNCPSITPSWGAEDSLFPVMLTFSPTVTITGYPTNYNDNQFTDDSGSTADDAGIGLASRSVNGSPEDPFQFSVSGSTTGCAKTFAIRPAEVVVGVPMPTVSINPQRW